MASAAPHTSEAVDPKGVLPDGVDPKAAVLPAHDDARPALPAVRALERFFGRRFAPFLTRGRNAAWCVAASVAVAAVLGVQGSYMQMSDEDVNIWPAWHNCRRYLLIRDRLFPQPKGQVYLLWGVSGVDRTGASAWDEDDLGQVVWDRGFDASAAAVQVAMRAACDTPLDAALLVQENATLCPISAFATWAEARNETWPLPPRRHPYLLDSFLDAQPWWLDQHALSVVKRADGGMRLRYAVAIYSTHFERHAPALRRRPIFEAWEAHLEAINGAAPEGAGQVLITAKQDWEAYFLQMVVLELLYWDVFLVIAISSIVSFFVVFGATRSLRGAVLALLAIGCVLCCLFGVMVSVYEIKLGFLETIVLMIAVGLMLDPFTHYVHAFAHAPGGRPQRLQAMLSSMGISVLAATLSTAGSCVALFFTVIVLFSRFGLLLCALMVIALLYANFFLAPMLLLCGPSSSAARTNDAAEARDVDEPNGDRARGTELMPTPARNGKGGELEHSIE